VFPLQWDSIGFRLRFLRATARIGKSIFSSSPHRAARPKLFLALSSKLKKPQHDLSIPATSFSTGLYEAELFIENARGKKIFRTNRVYIVHTPRSYVKYDLASLFSSLELIATPDE
jgi:hypothetical protein